MLKFIADTKETMQDTIEKFQLKKGIKALMELAKKANKYFDKSKPWETVKKNKEKCGATLNTCIQVVDGLATLMEPYLPFSSSQILQMLNIERNEWDNVGIPRIPKNKQLGKVNILYAKTENERIIMEKQKLGIGEEKMAGIITIDEFARTEMKIATIENAEKVENAQKLIKLVVDIGGEKRQVVAGIAEYYSPDELIGKSIVVVTNLAPAKLRGVESNGMLLAATKGNELSLLTIDKPIDSGAKIS